MRSEERLARKLFKRLRAQLDGEVRLEGGGLHWRVELPARNRLCVVHCFWYESAFAGLLLGMNPANQRAAGRPHHVVRTGAEYMVVLSEHGRKVAEGRTCDVDEAIACARAWVKREFSIAEIERELPFVDAPRRKMRELVALIEARVGDLVRCAIEYELLYELWVYREDRSCRLDPTEDCGVVCSFWLGQAEVADGDVSADPAVAIESWLLKRMTLHEIAALAPVSVERHADVLERGEAARWHWLHVADRVRDPGDVLVPCRPLIERLLERPSVTAFFSYTSLHWLCFSASSHFPWVGNGLPVVSPSEETGNYLVEIGGSRTTCSADTAADLIESTLDTYPIRPFFGSAFMLAIAPLNEELAAQGSSLRGKLMQRMQWYDARVMAGDRSCKVLHDNLRAVRFEVVGSEKKTAEYPDAAASVAAIRRWLEDRCTPDQL